MSKLKKIALICLIAAYSAISGLQHYRASDSYLRDRVVKLQSEQGSCSGIQVEAPSGKAYILTAAHCRILVDKEGHTTAINEQGEKRQVDFIAEDENSDLMLLTSGDDKAVSVGNNIHKHEKVHTITHGRGHDAYRTDGEAIEEALTLIGVSVITDMEEFVACIKQPKYTVVPTLEGMVCAIYTPQNYTTAHVVPGSSGGPLFNSDGELIGIVSATSGDGFSTFVRLSDIKSFLKTR